MSSLAPDADSSQHTQTQPARTPPPQEASLTTSSASSPRATGCRHASPHSTETPLQQWTPSLGRSWPNRCVKPSNGGSPQNVPTAPTTTRAQDTTPSAGESSTTTTMATTIWREPRSARPTWASCPVRDSRHWACPTQTPPLSTNSPRPRTPTRSRGFSPTRRCLTLTGMPRDEACVTRASEPLSCSRHRASSAWPRLSMPSPPRPSTRARASPT